MSADTSQSKIDINTHITHSSILAQKTNPNSNSPKVFSHSSNLRLSASEKSGTSKKSTRNRKTSLQVEEILIRGNIWEFSDNEPWFLAGLIKNNPQAKRKELETLVFAISPAVITNEKSISPFQPNLYASNAPILSTRQSISVMRKSEINTVIQKTLDLLLDMQKAVELIYHAIRACSRFLTYPTPSIPSDNYQFGQIKGWIWLLYKALLHFHPPSDATVEKDCMTKIYEEMDLLANEAYKCVSDCEKFTKDFEKIHRHTNKIANYLWKKGGTWTGRIEKYIRFQQQIQLKENILVDIHEDTYCGTNWVFEPNPSMTSSTYDFFHFQWIKTDSDWQTSEFEIRSDYSNRWIAYSTLESELQLEIIVQLMQHIRAMLNECSTFNGVHMILAFNHEELNCLKNAVLEIDLMTARATKGKSMGELVQKLFQEISTLVHISQQYTKMFIWILSLMDPVYKTSLKWMKDSKLEPLTFPRKKTFKRCCKRTDEPTFLVSYGTPMKAVLVRTPISLNALVRFFPPDYLITNMPTYLSKPNPLDKYGQSLGYHPSVFDVVMGRDNSNAPILDTSPIMVKARKSREYKFDIHLLNQHARVCITPDDKQLHTEEYILLFDQLLGCFTLLGSIFGSLSSDVRARVDELDNFLSSINATDYETLEKIIVYESSPEFVETHNALNGCKTFLKLHRVLTFVNAFFEKLPELEKTQGTSTICKLAYNNTLAYFHSWLYQKYAILTMYTLPTKQDLFERMGGEIDKPYTEAFIKLFVKETHIIIKKCENLLSKKGLELLLE